MNCRGCASFINLHITLSHCACERSQLSINDFHTPPGSHPYSLPVQDVPPGHPKAREHAMDGALRQDAVPHVDVADLPHETLPGVEIVESSVSVLTQDHTTTASHCVAAAKNLCQAFLPVHEDRCCTRLGVPGEAQVGLLGIEGLRHSESHVTSSEVQR